MRGSVFLVTAAMLLGGCRAGGASNASNPVVTVISAPEPQATATPTLYPLPASAPTLSPVAAPPPVQALSCTARDAVVRASRLKIVPVAGKITIVAIGSSSTYGAEASSTDASYPSVLQKLLSQHPDIAAFQVYNMGHNGEQLPQIQARLQADVLDLKSQVVFLQTGTTDAIFGQTAAALADFSQRLRAVVSSLKGKVAVVLVNSQHYPGEPPDYLAYQDVLAQVSREQDVPLFDRYGLMKSWIDSGKYKYADMLASDSFHPNDFTYRCMAEVAGDLILSASVAKGQ